MPKFQQPTPDQGRFVPTKTDAASPDALHPAFSLRYVEKRYCISDCDKSEKSHFAEKILKLSQMTWAQIKQSHRHSFGTEIISQLEAKLPVAAPKGAHALAFRFSGKKPMVGYRDGNIFYVVWFDREFTLYDHGS